MINAPGPPFGFGVGIQQVEAGEYHTCALFFNGSLNCWGSNVNGQLGTGDTIDRVAPGALARVAGAVQRVTSGGTFTCAILANQTLQCWGANDQGQLGQGDVTGRLTPASVPLPDLVQQVVAGSTHTCALLVNGSVACFGRNSYGQLGYGDTIQRRSPSGWVVTTAQVTQLASGDNHVCALLVTGNLTCWGHNDRGQIGNDGTSDQLSPASVGFSAATNITAVSCGGSYSCALLSNGSLRCWGDNSYGQLGRSFGSATYLAVPPAVDIPLFNVSTFSTGYRHACAIVKNGSVYCWGSNSNAQLGCGSKCSISSNYVTPVGPLSILGAIAIRASTYYHTCAVVHTIPHALSCFGDGLEGQLGDGRSDNSNVPTDPISLGGLIEEVEAGEYHTCALLRNGSVYCFGANNYGQLGYGDTTARSAPAPIAVPVGATVRNITTGDLITCALLTNYTVMCWGLNSDGQLGYGDTTTRYSPSGQLQISGPVQQVVAGSSHACALLFNGSVTCWGDGSAGQLGYGSTVTGLSSPGPWVATSATVTRLSSGDNHVCALLSSANLQCWGYNNAGQLGIGDQITRYLPASVVSFSDEVSVIAVTTAGSYTCATLDDGTVKCFGTNFEGQLGIGTTTSLSSPGASVRIGAVKIVSAGYSAACAILTNSTMECWGSNDSGQLGLGSTDGYRATPAVLQNLLPAVKVRASSGWHVCAVVLVA